MSTHDYTDTPSRSQSRPLIHRVGHVGLITDPNELADFRAYLDSPEYVTPCDTRLQRTIDGEVFDPLVHGCTDQRYLARVRVYRAAAHIAERGR